MDALSTLHAERVQVVRHLRAFSNGLSEFRPRSLSSCDRLALQMSFDDNRILTTLTIKVSQILGILRYMDMLHLVHRLISPPRAKETYHYKNL